MTSSPAKLRIINAARTLFSEHGVAGTSLQMIADTIGVTKAAIYHQYQTKEEIVYAVAEEVNIALAMMTELALQEATTSKQRALLLQQIVQLAVASRKLSGALQHDPSLHRLFKEQEPFKQVMDRLNNVLMGDNTSSEARVTVAAIITGIAGAVMHPLCEHVSDDVLNAQLQKIAKTVTKLL